MDITSRRIVVKLYSYYIKLARCVFAFDATDVGSNPVTSILKIILN